MRRRVTASILALFAAGSMLSCGGGATGPSPRVDPPPANSPPVIRSITASTPRTEFDRPVEFTVVAEDQETAPAALTYEWSADAGGFTGTGARVTWTAPRAATTPATYAIRVTVVERYQALGSNGQIVTNEYRVASDPVPVRVHNSRQELEEMGMRFLRNFANSDVSVEGCLTEFSNSCRGKEDERNDIEFNREHYKILSSSLNFTSANIFPNQLEAQVFVACSFTSQVTKCEPPAEWGGPCTVGEIEVATGTCRLGAVYEQSKWWLCESRMFAAETLAPSMRQFFGSID